MTGLPLNAGQKPWRGGTRAGVGTSPRFTTCILAAIIVFAGGCSTPYTDRVQYLDEKYQKGEMSREDYMRFVHDAERWEHR
jgi:hypothetical protein